MSAEPRVLKTEAEQALAAQARSVQAARSLPAPVAGLRQKALAEFERLGLPHRRVEAWKYTDLRAAMRRAAPLAPAPSAAEARRALAAADLLPGLERHRLVIADGHFQPDLSDSAALQAAGIVVRSFADLLASDEGAALLDAPAAAIEDALLALNTAAASDGVVMAIPAGARLSRPIEILHLTTGAVPAGWFSRNSVTVAPDAEVRLILSHHGPSGVPYQVNAFTNLTVGKGGKAKVVHLQAEGDAAQHVATFGAWLGDGAEFDQLAVATGAKLSRLQSFLAVAGEGVRVGAATANLLRGSAHGDVAMVLDHLAPGSRARVFARAVVEGQADGVFQGRIVVRPAAQKTDASMMVRSLLLSDTAEFASKPELEIYADDVQCGHGSTAGQIDEDVLFYLLSRGIPPAEAEGLMLTAFLAEAIDALGDEEIAAAIRPAIAAWLARRGTA